MSCEPNRFSWRMTWWAIGSAALTVLVAALQKAGLIPHSLRAIVALLPVAVMVGFFAGRGVISEAKPYVWIAAFLLWGIGLVVVRRRYQ